MYNKLRKSLQVHTYSFLLTMCVCVCMNICTYVHVRINFLALHNIGILHVLYCIVHDIMVSSMYVYMYV